MSCPISFCVSRVWLDGEGSTERLIIEMKLGNLGSPQKIRKGTIFGEKPRPLLRL